MPDLFPRYQSILAQQRLCALYYQPLYHTSGLYKELWIPMENYIGEAQSGDAFEIDYEEPICCNDYSPVILSITDTAIADR